MEGSCFSDIQRLPEECVSQAIARTSPRYACRSEAVSTAFRAAAMSDDVWKRFIPSDYAEILARAVDRVEFASMKHLYFRLCEPILIDGGKMGFYLDRETSAKCFILPARELWIVWGDTPQYWSWKHHPESRFAEVAELMDVCWLEIRGKIDSRILSERTNYAAYLIFKLPNSSRGFDHPFQEASLFMGGRTTKLSMCLVETDAYSAPVPMRPFLRRPRFMLDFLWRPNFPQEPPADLEEHEQLNNQYAEPQPNDQGAEPQEGQQINQQELREDVQEPGCDQHQARRDEHQARHVRQAERKTTFEKPQTRRDGWKEILLGEFYNEEGDDGEVDMALMEIKGGHWKSGLIVQGIEIRPKK